MLKKISKLFGCVTQATSSPGPGLPRPPVPQKLREILEGYPQHLLLLQKALDDVIIRPYDIPSPFELSVWLLEDALTGFMAEAYEELVAAEAIGDLPAVEQASRKQFAMGYARLNMGPMTELWEYFRTHKDALS